MKIMTYNIFDGGKGDLEAVIETIEKKSPDFLVVNEANGFEDNDFEKMKAFSGQINMPHYKLSLCGEEEPDSLWHVAVFSKTPFKEIKKIKPLIRAGILTVLDTKIGEICFVGTHLAPYSEDIRLKEVDLILEELKPYKNKVLVGDLNSLANTDDYDPGIMKDFNDIQMKKFTTDDRLRFDVINKIKNHGYIDTALLFDKQKDSTVPTILNDELAETDMRLDYIFVSESLKDKVSKYKVIKNPLTEKASDHYPVIIEIN